MTKIRLPKIMNETLDVFSNRYVNTSKTAITSIQILKVAQMITSKGVRYKNLDTIDIPNYYAIVLLPSGGGKDRISNEYDNLIFKPFRDWKKFEKNIQTKTINR